MIRSMTHGLVASKNSLLTTALLLALLLGLATTASAQPRHQATLGQLHGGDLGEAAFRFLDSSDLLDHLPTTYEIVSHEVRAMGDQTHVVFKLSLGELQTYGAFAILSVDPESRKAIAFDTSFHEVPRFEEVATIGPNLAVELASVALDDKVAWVTEDAELSYLVDPRGSLWLVWGVAAWNPEPGILSGHRVFLSAVDGDLVVVHDDVEHDFQVPDFVLRSAPAAPLLTATSEQCFGQNSLSWNSVPGATSYLIYASNFPSPSTAIQTGSTTSPTTFSVVNVANTTYYWVKACAGSCSGFSNRVQATYTPCCF